ncbi:MAG TPA: S41 family peptidase [Flavisolibacter sp.]|nr:S41 family peptidase [Flavisolibacter sp.]
MLKRLSILFIFFAVIYSGKSAAQNPAAAVKDTNLSLPERSFEVFWQTFEDNYAFFSLRKIDWQAAYRDWRSKVDANISDDSLFSILSQMVGPFQDDHINIIVPGKKQFTARKPSHFMQEFPDQASRAKFWTMVDSSLVRKGFSQPVGIGPEHRGKNLFYFSRSREWAYLRIGRCFVSRETVDSPKVDAQLAGRILDSVLTQLQGVKAILLDVRNNIGGNDEFAYAIAGRFASKRTKGHSKQTRTGGYEEFGPLENWYIEPLGKRPFNGQVIMLTNDQTASAGDVLAMIMSVLLRVTLVGDNTLGIYSDMYGFELPNGWQVSLSNQRYYDADMICYEGRGTPVDLVVRNTGQDLEKGSDPVIEAAVLKLRHVNNSSAPR